MKRLWRGEVPLVRTYWVFGFAVNVFFSAATLLFSVLAPDYIFFALGLLVLLFVSLVYMVFISVAIWRSANRYEGNKGWAFLAKAVVVLSYVKLLADFADIG